MPYSPSLERLIEQFQSLPGIGRKSAVRLAFYILSQPQGKVEAFSAALTDAKVNIHLCPVCQSLTDGQLCAVCADTRRERGVVCVVSSPKDVATFERVKDYKGMYHVLHGCISPMDGISPDQLKIKELLTRLSSGEVKEVIVATNPDTEGEATAMYLSRLIKPLGVKVSRIAYGLPVGGELEFADDMTLFRALEGRREL
ncbi:MAG: recombination mediator RecR [Eubacteriales bacterium]